MKSVYFRNGGLSFRQLINTCNNVCEIATRDANELKTVGISPAMVASLKAQVSNLESLSTFALDAAAKKLQTAERNNLKPIVLDEINILRKQLVYVFAKGTNNYDSIFTKSLSGRKIDEFVNALKNIVITLQNNALLVAEYGVDAERISAFSELVSTFVGLYEQQLLTKLNFKLSAAERSQKRQEAYKLLNYIVSLANAYWKRKDATKAAQYSIN